MGIEVSVNRKDSIEDHARLLYTTENKNTGETRRLDYEVRIVSTPCHFGGVRYWFICPGRASSGFCGRRVGKLYLPGNATYFGCRHCYNLTYKSCKEHDSRLSAAMRLPPHELEKLLKSKDPKSSLLGIRAWFKMLDKFR